jgi:hypothetical protein
MNNSVCVWILLSWLVSKTEERRTIVSFRNQVGPSGREVISLQKADSLLVFECKGELKRFMRSRIRGIREKPSEYGLDGSMAENASSC